MDKTTIAVILVAAGIGATRFLIPRHGLSFAGSYEAFAHLFVGGLIGAALAFPKDSLDRHVGGMSRYFLLEVVGVLSAVELLAFLVLR